jgi:hypothetical protein
MQLRQLRSVALEHTGVSDEHYGLLLSELPQITDIRFWEPESNILDHITVENVDTISHVSGYVDNISMLTQKCPNITNLDLYTISGDLSHLTALTSLHSLEIAIGHYGTCNLKIVLRGIGHRLTNLSLSKIRNVNLQDIVTLCPGLEILALSECLFLPLNPNTELDPRLPHFRSVITLQIEKHFSDQIAYKYLPYYKSLKTIALHAVNIFTVDVMRDALRKGTFTHLENFHIRETGHGALDIEAVELLINNCRPLKSLGFLGSCPRFNPALIRELKRRILRRNLDLEIRE